MSEPKFTEEDADLILKMGGCINEDRTSAEISFLCIHLTVERLQDGCYRCQLHDHGWALSEDQWSGSLKSAIQEAFGVYIDEANIADNAVLAISSFKRKMEAEDE